jgi:hypothetical protein
MEASNDHAFQMVVTYADNPPSDVRWQEPTKAQFPILMRLPNCDVKARVVTAGSRVRALLRAEHLNGRELSSVFMTGIVVVWSTACRP